MNVVFISHFYKPHVGGVEKHVEKIGERLRVLGHEVIIIAKNHPIKFPNIKFLGLLKIWLELFKLRKVIKKADIVHIHDVFIWYLPFKLIYPRKKVFITFHGGQDIWPVPLKNKFMVQLAEKLTNGNICVGSFIPRYFDIKADKVIYGGVSNQKANAKKINAKLKSTIAWVGRLDKNTDLPEFLHWLTTCYKLPATVFVGDGELRSKCEKYGKVTGLVSDVSKYLKTAETVVPVGYLSYLEAKSWGCKIMVFPKTAIKRDYWKGIERLKSIPTWDDVAKIYLRLWKN